MKPMHTADARIWIGNRPIATIDTQATYHALRTFGVSEVKAQGIAAGLITIKVRVTCQ